MSMKLAHITMTSAILLNMEDFVVMMMRFMRDLQKKVSDWYHFYISHWHNNIGHEGPDGQMEAILNQADIDGGI